MKRAWSILDLVCRSARTSGGVEFEDSDSETTTWSPLSYCVSFLPRVLFQWVVGANLVALGQALNVGIYRSIGKVGVYYGYKYGMSVPWCTGFPFNVCCAHPQYLGSALTAYGLVLLAATDAHVLRGWGGLAHVQALQYAYMSFVEHNL